jgi:uncharacterized protein (TIGR00290 family)
VRIPVVLSWSGGKDSSLALAALRASDEFEPVALLTSVTREYDRISIHGVRRTLLLAQAEMLGLPLFEVGLQAGGSNDEYERAFAAGVESVQRALPHVRHMAFGDLHLADVRAYREQLIASLGIQGVFPLWGVDTRALAGRFVREEYGAHLVCVDTTQLDASFCGRPFDDALLAELPPSVDPCGEHGEFHTFVSSGPIFAKPLRVETGEIVLRDGRFAYCDLLPAGPLAAIES